MVIQLRQSGTDAWGTGGRYPSDSRDAERLFGSRDYECVGISGRRLLNRSGCPHPLLMAALGTFRTYRRSTGCLIIG